MKLFFQISALLMLGFASASAAPELDACPTMGDMQHVHGHLVFGEKRMFIEHLPLFDRMHRYQIISEASVRGGMDSVLGTQAMDAQETYRREWIREGRYFTMRPRPFDLPLTLCRAGRSFGADILSGHYERRDTKPTQVLLATNVRIDKTLHFRKFVNGAVNGPAAEFILLGDESELYLSHRIVAPPDFQQIVKVKLAPGSSLGALASGDILRVEEIAEGPGIAPEQRRLRQRAAAYVAKSRDGAVTLEFLVEKEIFFESGELAE